MKVNKEYISYLARREAELRILQREQVRHSFVEMECSEAWIEMMLKVKSSPDDSEARKFWEDKLLTVHRLFDEAVFLRNEYLTLEVHYNTLYNKYQEMLDLNLELQNKVSIFEEEFNKIK